MRDNKQNRAVTRKLLAKWKKRLGIAKRTHLAFGPITAPLEDELAASCDHAGVLDVICIDLSKADSVRELERNIVHELLHTAFGSSSQRMHKALNLIATAMQLEEPLVGELALALVPEKKKRRVEKK